MSHCDIIRQECGSDVLCCESCHEDYDRGYPMSEVGLPMEEPPAGLGGEETFEVCCAVARAFRAVQDKMQAERFS